MSDRDSITALNYHDSCVRLSDVDLLKGPYWLNDQIISFYFQYLEKEIYEGESSFLFVSPEVTQCIKIVSQEEVQIFLEPLDALNKQFIFFPLNDNSQDSVGGSHWNLIVYSKPENTFFNFDSAGSSNYYPSKKLVEILKKALKCHSAQLQSGESLQQSNSYDCGIHVLCTADHVLRHICKSGRVAGVSKVRPAIINTKRGEILQIIRDLGGRTN